MSALDPLTAPDPPVLPPLESDPVDLALALVNVPSVSGGEGPLADAVEAALAATGHLEVLRHGNTVVARTHLGRSERIVVAGHLDTVPVSQVTSNVPGRLEGQGDQAVVWGRGSVDMKAGVAVGLHLAASLQAPSRDVTWVFYDNEEVAESLNGLGLTLAAHPHWLAGDLAVLGEPTNAAIEGGCNGTLRLVLDVPGVAAHSARAWRGVNAVHAAATLIERVRSAPARTVGVEGLDYRESWSVVGIEAGVATNTVPDSCRLSVNYRFAPDLSERRALARAWRVLAGLAPDGAQERPVIDVGTGPVRVQVDDLCPAARPGLESPLAAELVEAVRARGGAVGPKYGWTDVARFSAVGVPAVNLGPGDPMLAHTDDEQCPAAQIRHVAQVLREWLG